MTVIGIVASGPDDYVPNLNEYTHLVDKWIGADRGALKLIDAQIEIDYAVGDFDSINKQQKEVIQQHVRHFTEYPSEKDETDLELAIEQAFTLNPTTIYLFGITGGRLDHTMINIQLLHTMIDKQINGVIIDKWNIVKLKKAGIYKVQHNEHYPYISFIPFSQEVKGLTLQNFHYDIANQSLLWGSTLCISNEFRHKEGIISFSEGLLLIIKSKDLQSSL